MHPDSPFINARYCRDGGFNPQVLEGTNHEIYQTSPADIGLEHYAGPPTSHVISFYSTWVRSCHGTLVLLAPFFVLWNHRTRRQMPNPRLLSPRNTRQSRTQMVEKF
ncbi:hypothetical protein PISMIDRAFT_683746 [Pisolithus microcarpus 441]|uniref:Uncharacterized protein n=1 Tax=Pisolithus microcarpus 441 TaxID=765257 RepID=A0A0C9Y2F5_9AGAM|nr:hypothetical protein PISMIDRAFT_683746 [Pisolithus microcarpus 441]